MELTVYLLCTVVLMVVIYIAIEAYKKWPVSRALQPRTNQSNHVFGVRFKPIKLGLQSLFSSIDVACIETSKKNFANKQLVRGQKLGSGGWGDVYAIKGKSVEWAAKKTIRQQTRDNLDEQANEIRVIKEWNERAPHLRIPTLYNAAKDNRSFIMSLCPGGKLRDRMKKPYDSKRLMLWMEQILVTVGLFHLDRQIHFDLKLENILLDENDDAMVTDFGHMQTETDKFVFPFGSLCPEYGSVTFIKGRDFVKMKAVHYKEDYVTWSFYNDIYAIYLMLTELLNAKNYSLDGGYHDSLVNLRHRLYCGTPRNTNGSIGCDTDHLFVVQISSQYLFPFEQIKPVLGSLCDIWPDDKSHWPDIKRVNQ